jgi:transcriptional regulator with XRE-family HTH domain
MTFGELLKALAKASGQSLISVAAEACVTKEYMWAISCGRVQPPPAHTRKRIVTALGSASYRGPGGKTWTGEDLHYLAADERRNCAGCDEREWCEAAKRT